MQANSRNDDPRLEDIAKRHGFSVSSVRHMSEAIRRGQGSMAQFTDPEFGGQGQWLAGGMTMVSDMFNADLKMRVANLCADLAGLAAEMPLGSATSAQTQRQSRGPAAPDAMDARAASNWWPNGWGQPASVGTQNDVGYAYFSAENRLAVRTGRRVVVYDTGDRRIGGFSQWQSGAAGHAFTAQDGPIALADLKALQEYELGDAGPDLAAAPGAASQEAASLRDAKVREVAFRRYEERLASGGAGDDASDWAEAEKEVDREPHSHRVEPPS